jgi:hypothetical protein
MLRRRVIAGFFAAALLLAFLAALGHLIRLRYEAGDVYPPYSTLRADPLGSKAFFESLERFGQLRVERNVRDLAAEHLPGKVTLLYLGVQAHDLTTIEEELVKEWQVLLGRGGRVVISAFPENARPLFFNAMATARGAKPKPAGGKPQNQPPQKPQNRDDLDFSGAVIPIEDLWGVDFNFLPLPKDKEENYLFVDAKLAQPELPLPTVLPWHSSICFTNLDQAWRTVYERENQPVIIERAWHGGSVVLVSDSYLLSNEALRSEREPGFLAWLIGSSERVVFDEVHHGVRESAGIATLMRQYQLHGLIVVLFLLAMLFVWRNSTSLVPPYEEERDLEHVIGGKDSAAGFVNLLRRSIPRSKILRACYEQWKTDCGRNRPEWRTRIESMEEILASEESRDLHQRNFVQAYRKLAQTLHPDKH